MRGVVLSKLVLVCLTSLTFSSIALSQVGTTDYVPNGSFEYISKPDALLGNYDWRFGLYSLYWRQFHSWTIPGEPGTLPDWPIWKDRKWSIIDYEPVTCTSSDLFSAHLPNCMIPPPSVFDVPTNWLGTEPIRPATFGQKYAGLYYRLNGIRMNADNTASEPFAGDPATDFWREYLEVELLCELQADTTYTLSFWVSLGESSNRTLRLEARVSEKPYHTNPYDDCSTTRDNDELPAHNRVPVTDGAPGVGIASATDIPMDGWTLVTGTITAAGGEKYLTIGNFDAEPVVHLAETVPPECLADWWDYYPNSQYKAYFYIDDVKLQKVEACACTMTARMVPIKPSAVEGKCCFNLFVRNGHGEFTCRSCTVEYMNVYSTNPNGSETLVKSWSSAESPGPIVGDDLEVGLGQICIDEF